MQHALLLLKLLIELVRRAAIGHWSCFLVRCCRVCLPPKAAMFCGASLLGSRPPASSSCGLIRTISVGGPEVAFAPGGAPATADRRVTRVLLLLLLLLLLLQGLLQTLRCRTGDMNAILSDLGAAIGFDCVAAGAVARACSRAAGRKPVTVHALMAATMVHIRYIN
jgi:hypothetical protein